MFDEFNCVFIDCSQDLQYNELNWFLECQKFLILRGTITKNLRLKVSYNWFLKCGDFLYFILFNVLNILF